MEIITRLSHSFPPDYTENKQYRAKVHKVIKKYNVQINPQKMYFHYNVTEDLINEIQELHKEWFPVEYTESFFDGLLHNKKNRTILILYDFEHHGKSYKLILGCLVYEYRLIDHDIAKFKCSDLCTDTYGIYILTFGVINEVRSKGVSTMLLNKLFELAEMQDDIKYFYLDVVEYNEPGRRCYERNGFVKVYVKRNHYNLFEKRYNALVYCRYVNGGRQPMSTKELLYNCITLCNIPCKVFNTVTKKVKKVLEYHRRSIKYKELKV